LILLAANEDTKLAPSTLLGVVLERVKERTTKAAANTKNMSKAFLVLVAKTPLLRSFLSLFSVNEEEDGMVCSNTYYVSSLEEVIARVLKYYFTAGCCYNLGVEYDRRNAFQC